MNTKQQEEHCNRQMTEKTRDQLNFIIANRIVDTLNDAHNLDPNAFYSLRAMSVAVNNELAEHPRILVGVAEDASVNGDMLRYIGLFNGLLDVDSHYQVAEMWDTDNDSNTTTFSGYAVFKHENDKTMVWCSNTQAWYDWSSTCGVCKCEECGGPLVEVEEAEAELVPDKKPLRPASYFDLHKLVSLIDEVNSIYENLNPDPDKLTTALNEYHDLRSELDI